MKLVKWIVAKIADNIAGVVITAIGGSLLVFLASARDYVGALWDWFVAPVEISRWLLMVFIMSTAVIAFLLIRGLLAKAIEPEPPAWKTYREDTFEGALWRWDYDFNNVITDVRPYCSVCDCALNLNRDLFGQQLSYVCVACNSEKDCFPNCSTHNEAVSTITTLIEHRVRQKSYRNNGVTS
ncbi:hypothetical protein [Pseudomonas sp. JUb52]|uniref:hypothetical protein n=1 Tax=Pseudomonas sp. JUb52 TaxID=2485127 RepID=UPI00104C0A9C|nr:hypothetical protein [Pseudomonas sp. JUb52]